MPAEEACMHVLASMLCRYIGVLPVEKLQLALQRMLNYVRLPLSVERFFRVE